MHQFDGAVAHYVEEIYFFLKYILPGEQRSYLRLFKGFVLLDLDI